MKNSFWVLGVLSLTLFACPPKTPEERPAPGADPRMVEWLNKVGDDVDSIVALEQHANACRYLDSTLSTLAGIDLGPADTLAALLYRRLTAFYFGQGDYLQAQRAARAAVNRRKRVSGAAHPETQRFYSNLGTAYFFTSEYNRARMFFDSALVEAPERPYASYYGKARVHRAECYSRLGQPDVCREQLEQFIDDAARDSFHDEGVHLADASLYLSDACRKLKQYEPAITYGKRGAGRADNIITAAGCFLNTGHAWQDSMERIAGGPADPRWKQAADSATYYCRLALDTYRDNDAETQFVQNAVNSLGELYRRRRLPQQAVDILTLGIHQVEHPAAHAALLAQLHLNRGEAWRDAGHFARAGLDYRTALQHLLAAPLPADPADWPPLDVAAGHESIMLTLLADLADLELRQYEGDPDARHLSRARAIYASLMDFSDRIRSDFFTEEAQINLAQDLRGALDNAFAVTMRLHRLTADSAARAGYLASALRISEQCKAMALLESVRLNNTALLLPEHYQRWGSHLRRRLAATREQLAVYRSDAVRQAALARERNELTLAWHRHQDSLKTHFPAAYRQLQLGAHAGLNEIQESLDGDAQGVLEFFALGDSLHLFLITRSGLQHRVSALSPTFDRDVDSIQTCLNDLNQAQWPPELRRRIFLEKGLALRRQLLPLVGWTTTTTTTTTTLPRRLTIIPDERFAILPFELLLMRELAADDLRAHVEAENFLVHHFVFSYCYSVNLLAEMRERRAGVQKKRVLACFAPFFPESGQPLQPGASGLAPDVVETLPQLVQMENEHEIDEIGRASATRRYTRRAARRERFLEACRDNVAVHVASHGILVLKSPRLNYISFSQFGPAVDPDEFLYTENLYGENLDLELAVFSACRTAVGEQIKSEGTVSLARGLARAGVRSFITTACPVRPTYNASLMKDFYKNLVGRQLPRDSALALAKREFIAGSLNHHDPSFWAGLLLTGVTDRLALEPPATGWSGWSSLGLGAALLGFGGMVAGWRRRIGRRQRQ